MAPDDEGYDSDLDRRMVIVRAKWTLDGAATLAEAVAKAKEFVVYLESLEREGYTLTQVIEDDYGFLLPPDSPTSTLSGIVS